MSRPQDTLESVKPAQPVAPWLGGKRRLAKRIIARIEAIPHACYAEPFAGMGGVFLRRAKKPKCEILNDLNGEIVNLFRVIGRHPDELLRQFEWALSARDEFRRMLAVSAETLTDVERAARFVYVQRQSFGGRPATKATPGDFAPSPHNPARFDPRKLEKTIRAVHDRLKGVHIECLEWDAFIRRYDRPGTLFYIDPPYWGHEADYGKGLFARDDFTRMAEVLRDLKGRFILSINDRPEVRELFAGFDLEAVQTRYTANHNRGPLVGELLISTAS